MSFLLLLLLLLPNGSSASLIPSEMAALLDIRSNLRDLPGSNFFSTWNFTTTTTTNPCSSFAGVICSLDRVSVLTLGTGLADSPGLAGNLPSSLSALTSLTDLIIFPGRISGQLPSFTSPNLRLISISNNLISGPIPSTLFSLQNLHTLDLSDNRLNGSIPVPLLLLPSLKVLILASNSNLSGQIPPEISSTQLLHLDLRQNSFTGPLPPLPTTLRYLSASSNSLSGSLDTAFSPLLSNLSFLDLSMNAFTGQIPPSIFSIPQLSSILLQRNSLSGELTLTAGLTWTVVDLSHNMISGEIPLGLAAAESLFLNNNRLTGSVPEEYSRGVYEGTITTFYAQHNFLTAFTSPPLLLPESVSVCLAYNCMIPPPSAASGCPASAGTQPSRPPYQCPIATASTGGR